MKVGIVGCGLVGQKRARALRDSSLVACADVVPERAEALARGVPGAPQALVDWRALVDRPDVDVVVVATPHDLLTEVALAAVSAGKHVLVEKPAARRADELDPLIAAAARAGVLVRVGFNHRYHPALQKAKALAAEGAVGDLVYVRGRYGHGGRLGYEKEWRAEGGVWGGGAVGGQ